MCMVCSGMSVGDFGDRIRRQVHRCGWATAYVFGSSDRSPGFGYTIGLSRWDHPEFIMFDEHPECCAGALSRVAELASHGRVFDEGDDLSDVYPESRESVLLLRFPDSATHLFLANDLFPAVPGQPVDALQVCFRERTPLLRHGTLALPP